MPNFLSRKFLISILSILLLSISDNIYITIVCVVYLLVEGGIDFVKLKFSDFELKFKREDKNKNE